MPWTLKRPVAAVRSLFQRCCRCRCHVRSIQNRIRLSVLVLTGYGHPLLVLFAWPSFRLKRRQNAVISNGLLVPRKPTKGGFRQPFPLTSTQLPLNRRHLRSADYDISNCGTDLSTRPVSGIAIVVGGAIGLMWFIGGYRDFSFGSRATVWVDRPSAVSGGAVADFNTIFRLHRIKLLGCRNY